MKKYVPSFNYEDYSITLGINAKRSGASSSITTISLLAVLGVATIAAIGGAVFFFRKRKQAQLASDDYLKEQEDPLATTNLNGS